MATAFYLPFPGLLRKAIAAEPCRSSLWKLLAIEGLPGSNWQARVLRTDAAFRKLGRVPATEDLRAGSAAGACVAIFLRRNHERSRLRLGCWLIAQRRPLLAGMTQC